MEGAARGGQGYIGSLGADDSGVIGALGYVIATPKVGERFTESHILGSQGKAEGYPQSLSLGGKGEVILGVVNHEQEEMNYQVKVIMKGTGEGGKTWVENENVEIVAVANNAMNIEALANREKWERSFFLSLCRGARDRKWNSCSSAPN